MSPMFVPGPVDVDPQVLAAQAKPMLPHRSKDFEAMFASTGERLKQVFFTQHRVFQGTHSGSGMQEMAVRNLAESSVLACVNGAFAQRWYDVAVANGKQTDKIEAEWGQVFQPDQLRDALKAKHYELVLIVHNETSTGAENPVAALCKAVQETSPDTLIAVDAVSSLGGVKIPMDEWGIDFLLTSSQKCFALPPGLSFAGVNERAMKKAETVSNRGWYFDILLMEKHRIKDSTPMTPVMPLIYALDVQLDRMLAEGLDARFARHASMARRTQAWAESLGMQPLAADPYRSKTVSTVNNFRGWDISALNKFLLTKGMRIANGYGKLKDLTYRIAHMGEIQMSDVEKLLALMEEFDASQPK
jgi:aspartate aminotransferase-like enzyme